jgi:hypothetical protein
MSGTGIYAQLIHQRFETGHSALHIEKESTAGT